VTHWDPEKIAALEMALKGGQVAVGGDFDLGPGLAHGAVHAVLGTMERLGIRGLLSSRVCDEQPLVMGLIAARILDPGSKLSTARALDPRTATSTLGEELGIAGRPVEDFYGAMDWLAERQGRIEGKLAKRHLVEGALVLYDMTSVYMEGSECELARFGRNKEGRRGKLQFLLGLLCTKEGIPVSIQVFEGNAGETGTLKDQIARVKKVYGLERVAFVADRGILRDIRIKEDLAPAGLDWITAFRRPDIKEFVAKGAIQRSLFDTQDWAEFEDPEYPGERLMACFNPFQSGERARRRNELLASTEKELKAIASQVSRGRLKGLAEIGMKVGAVVDHYGTGRFLALQITEAAFTFSRKEDLLEQDALLDGIYVIRTSLPKEAMDGPSAVRSYKRLAEVEEAFRCLKTVDLQVRPVYHRLTERVRAHAFICMLAYYTEWHMKQALAPLLNVDEGRDAAKAEAISPVKSVPPTRAAISKRGQKRNAEGDPVQSFHGVLKTLATLTRSSCKPKDSRLPSFAKTATPTPYQQKVFDLLQVGGV
jgi:hypothetical protein